jgi:saccharopine dehydrogenase-like NADP-dependent oxidoreductase
MKFIASTASAGAVGVLLVATIGNAFTTRPLSTQRRSLYSVLNAETVASNISFDAIDGKNVLVVGGSGRVGGSVVTQLIKRGGKVTVGATRQETFEASRARWMEVFPELSPQLQQVDFVAVNREDASSVSPKGYDLVVHTAGPFQGKIKTPNGIIEACVESKVPYIDVCDDYCTAMAAKAKYAEKAKEGDGVACIVSTGCWPGVSSLMAKQLVDKALKSNASLTPADINVDFGFFTAGSGGAGSTLLVATFLILAEEALTVVKGRRTPIKAMKDYSTVNFGPIVGDKPIAHLNLLETASV